jgi:hypothetical protein
MLQLLWQMYSAGRYFNTRRLFGKINDLKALLLWEVNAERSCNLTYTKFYKERTTFILEGRWILQEQTNDEGRDVKLPLNSISP